MLKAQVETPVKFRTLLITADAGGVGLNLQFASRVIIAEPLWNAQAVDQMIARCWRKGQTRQVNVYHILALNSAIDFVYRTSQRRKIHTINEIMGQIRPEEGVFPTVPI